MTKVARLFDSEDRRQTERRRWSDEAFLSFWAAYPRKVGRVAAKKEWDRLRPTEDIVKAMADALEWQREQWDDVKFIPHPRTWLCQQRWEDEKPEASVKKVGQSAKTAGNLAAITRFVNRGGDDD